MRPCYFHSWPFEQIYIKGSLVFCCFLFTTLILNFTHRSPRNRPTPMLRLLTPNIPPLFSRSARESRMPSTKFTYDVHDLADLVNPAKAGQPDTSMFTGIEDLCRGLSVDPTVGLCSDEAGECSIGNTSSIKFADRKQAFGYVSLFNKPTCQNIQKKILISSSIAPGHPRTTANIAQDDSIDADLSCGLGHGRPYPFARPSQRGWA